ncbi:unnamed protein product [Miscanthus lutarioriparius]|uniref:Uncharacterized protein n=1 Tax=Miscanthus lutarioriparius TaxID=422564 RepID=A0A811MMD8_9POAL|nr:unnamed protein product [Miscanthus lutarioriparius]
MKVKEEVDYEILYKKMEREVDQLTSEMERQQKVIRSEKMQMDKRLKESERSFHDLRMTSNMQIEVTELEKLLNENKQQQLENLSKTKFLTDTTKEHEKEMGELLRKLEEER